MGFLAVRYTHGVREYGKDFTFSELTPFGVMRHYGLQAKAGDVSGGVNSAIDELIGQANDAFTMSYYEIASTEPATSPLSSLPSAGASLRTPRTKSCKRPLAAFGARCSSSTAS
jgi:hypothetical protein